MLETGWFVGAGGARTGPMSEMSSVLFVANFAPDTGYAWDFIQRLYAGIADHLARAHGVRGFVAYPRLDSPADALRGSSAEPVELPLDLDDARTVRRAADFVAHQGVRVLYLTDHPSRSRAFRVLRRAGIDWLIVHDHTSGHRPRPGPLRRMAKRSLNLVPGLGADVVVTVSEYVARRQREVVCFPPARIVTIPNGVPLPRGESSLPLLRDELGLSPERPLVACACRAHPVKGVHHLLRAFDRVMRAREWDPRPVLVFAGDGPQGPELRGLRERLPASGDIVLAGYRPNAVERLRDAALFVAPSVWQDALPLSVMEPMALGKPVVASRVGGVPEMIADGESGVLVEPGDEGGLARAIERMLTDRALGSRMGQAARERVATRFRPDAQLRRLTYLTEIGLGGVCEPMSDAEPEGWEGP